MRGGDWECTCGYTNFEKRNTCRECGNGRNGNKSNKNSSKNNYDEDWKCDCGFANFGRRTTCRECGKDKGSKSVNNTRNNNNNNNNNDSNNNYKPGDWECTCGYTNFGKRNTCRECGKGNNSSGGSKNNYEEGDWKCDCGFSNFSKRNTCRECGKDKGTKSGSNTTEIIKNNNNNRNSNNYKPGDWKCSCGFNNFASRTNCKDCGKNKESNSNSSSNNSFVSNRVEMKKGDWICTCGFLNYARRNTCMECHGQQPKGNQMKEGDWICSCGFKNFASRSNCKECDLPKDLNPNQSTNKNKISNLKRLVILDFEATCDEPKNPSPQEIIEFPSVIVDIQQKNITDSIQFYVKPKSHPKLTKFCTNLTGITQKQVDESQHFPQVFSDYKNWLKDKKLFVNPLEEVFVTCGDWDLRKCLPQQLLAIKMDNEPCFEKWINIKNEFSKFYNKRAQGMMEMLYSLDIKHVGRHHSGLDDCNNIANIVLKMLEDGWVPFI